MMRFWNKLHQARSKSQDWNAKKFESFDDFKLTNRNPYFISVLGG
jgi:hypothetical protein